MNKNTLVIVVICIVVLLFGGFFLGRLTTHSTVVDIPQRNSLGAVASADIQSPCFSVGGVQHCYARATINQASTTACSLQSPIATSTLRFASITLTTGTTTAIVLDIGKSTNPTATTTLFSSTNLSSNQVGTIIASTTVNYGGSIDPATVFAAGVATSTTSTGIATNDYNNKQYLVYKYGGTQGATNVLVGTCQAEWIVNQ